MKLSIKQIIILIILFAFFSCGKENTESEKTGFDKNSQYSSAIIGENGGTTGGAPDEGAVGGATDEGAVGGVPEIESGPSSQNFFRLALQDDNFLRERYDSLSPQEKVLIDKIGEELYVYITNSKLEWANASGENLTSQDVSLDFGSILDSIIHSEAYGRYVTFLTSREVESSAASQSSNQEHVVNIDENTDTAPSETAGWGQTIRDGLGSFSAQALTSFFTFGVLRRTIQYGIAVALRDSKSAEEGATQQEIDEAFANGLVYGEIIGNFATGFFHTYAARIGGVIRAAIGGRAPKVANPGKRTDFLFAFSRSMMEMVATDMVLTTGFSFGHGIKKVAMSVEGLETTENPWGSYGADILTTTMAGGAANFVLESIKKFCSKCTNLYEMPNKATSVVDAAEKLKFWKMPSRNKDQSVWSYFIENEGIRETAFRTFGGLTMSASKYGLGKLSDHDQAELFNVFRTGAEGSATLLTGWFGSRRIAKSIYDYVKIKQSNQTNAINAKKVELDKQYSDLIDLVDAFVLLSFRYEFLNQVAEIDAKNIAGGKDIRSTQNYQYLVDNLGSLGNEISKKIDDYAEKSRTTNSAVDEKGIRAHKIDRVFNFLGDSKDLALRLKILEKNRPNLMDTIFEKITSVMGESLKARNFTEYSKFKKNLIDGNVDIIDFLIYNDNFQHIDLNDFKFLVLAGSELLTSNSPTIGLAVSDNTVRRIEDFRSVVPSVRKARVARQQAEVVSPTSVNLDLETQQVQAEIHVSDQQTSRIRTVSAVVESIESASGTNAHENQAYDLEEGESIEIAEEIEMAVFKEPKRTGALSGNNNEDYLKEIIELEISYEDMTTYQKYLIDKYIPEYKYKDKHNLQDIEEMSVYQNDEKIVTDSLNFAPKKFQKDFISWKNKTKTLLEQHGYSPEEWIPIISQTEEVSSGNYALKFVKNVSPQENPETITINTGDREFLNFKNKFDHQLESGFLRTSGQSEDLIPNLAHSYTGGMFGLATAIRGMIAQGISDSDSPYLKAITAHMYFNLTYAGVSTVTEANSVFKIAKMVQQSSARILIRDASMPVTSASKIGAALLGKAGIAFSVVNVGFDISELVLADNPVAKVYAGTALGLDIANTGLAIGAEAFAGSVVGDFAGPLLVPLMGLAISLPVLAGEIEQKLQEQEQYAKFFKKYSELYLRENADGYYNDDLNIVLEKDKDNLTFQGIRGGVPIHEINFLTRDIVLSPVYMYVAGTSKGPTPYSYGDRTTHCRYSRCPYRSLGEVQLAKAINLYSVWVEEGPSDYGSREMYIPKPFHPLMNEQDWNIFLLPTEAPFYANPKHGLVPFSRVDSDLEPLRVFNNYNQIYNPDWSLDMAWKNGVDFHAQERTHFVRIQLDSHKRILAVPKRVSGLLPKGKLTYQVILPPNREKTTNIFQVAASGKTTVWIKNRRGRQQLIVTGLKGNLRSGPMGRAIFDKFPDDVNDLTLNSKNGGIAEYDQTEKRFDKYHFDNADILVFRGVGSADKGGSSEAGIYFSSDNGSKQYEAIELTSSEGNSGYNILPTSSSIDTGHPSTANYKVHSEDVKNFLHRHLAASEGIYDIGKDTPIVYNGHTKWIQSWFLPHLDKIIFPKISGDLVEHEFQLLSLGISNGNKIGYFFDYDNKEVFSTLLGDTDITSDKEFIEQNPQEYKRYFDEFNDEFEIVRAKFSSTRKMIIIETKKGLYWGLKFSRNTEDFSYILLGADYEKFISSNPGNNFSALKSYIKSQKSQLENAGQNLAPISAIGITFTYEKNSDKETRLTYWYSPEKSKFSAKENPKFDAFDDDEEVLLDLFKDYALVTNSSNKNIVATEILYLRDISSNREPKLAKGRKIIETTNLPKGYASYDEQCLEKFNYVTKGVLFMSHCNRVDGFQIPNGVLKRYQFNTDQTFSIHVDKTSDIPKKFIKKKEIVAFTESFDPYRNLGYLSTYEYIANILLDSGVSRSEKLFIPWFKNKKVYWVIPPEDENDPTGADITFGAGRDKFGQHVPVDIDSHVFVGYNSKRYRSYVFDSTNKKLIEVYGSTSKSGTYDLDDFMRFNKSIYFQVNADSNVTIPAIDDYLDIIVWSIGAESEVRVPSNIGYTDFLILLNRNEGNLSNFTFDATDFSKVRAQQVADNINIDFFDLNGTKVNTNPITIFNAFLMESKNQEDALRDADSLSVLNFKLSNGTFSIYLDEFSYSSFNSSNRALDRTLNQFLYTHYGLIEAGLLNYISSSDEPVPRSYYKIENYPEGKQAISNFFSGLGLNLLTDDE